jgi:type IV secretory pathway TrbL component
VKADRPPAEPQAETAATTAAYSSEDVMTADRTAAATATTATAAADKAAVEPAAETALIQASRSKIYGTFGTRVAEGNEETADQAAGSRMGQLLQRSIVSLQSIPKVTKNTKSVGLPPAMPCLFDSLPDL